MKPYYQDAAVTLYHGDCRDIVPSLGTFDLVAIDPPYGKVRGDFDQKWTNRTALLVDAVGWRDLAADAMKPNGTLFWFAWPSLAGRIEAMLAEKLNVLAHIVWIKPNAIANKACPQKLRAPHPETERILMAEHYGSDRRALDGESYHAKCEEARRFVFERLRAYLADEMRRAGWTCAQVDAAWRSEKGNKGGMSSHWFGRSQWELPTRENYEWLRRLFNSRGNGEYLRREYEYLRREYEDLRREYEDLRRYFKLQPGDPKTDVWHFRPSGNKHGHPTEKPLDLMRFIVRIACRPGGTVLDFFAGSGTTGVAAKDCGRKAVLVEIDERYCEIAAKRLAAHAVLPLEMSDEIGEEDDARGN